MIRYIFLCCCYVLFSPGTAFSSTDPYDSGGELIREQAAFNVRHYDLNLSVDPEEQYIR